MNKQIVCMGILLLLSCNIAYALDNTSRLSDWIGATEQEKVSFCKTVDFGDATEWGTWYDFLETTKSFYPNENGKLLDYCKMIKLLAN